MALRRLHRRHGRAEAVDAARPVTAMPRAVSAFGRSAARSRRDLNGAKRISLSISLQPPSDIVVLSDLTLDLRVVSTFHEERHSPYASCFCKGQFSDYIQARGIHCTSNIQSTVQTLTAPRASTLQSSGTSPELRVRTRRAGDERGA